MQTAERVISLKESIRNGFISADQVTSVDELFELFELIDFHRQAVEEGRQQHTLNKITVADAFFEPSTRTRESFVKAIKNLGGNNEHFEVFSSSVNKKESLLDTMVSLILTKGCSLDAVVQRHPVATAAADVQAHFQKISEAQTNGLDLDIPNHWPIILNAGSGNGEHPTQAILDAYTIYRKLRQLSMKFEGLKVMIVGDLLNGRTVHSLLKVLAHFPEIELILVSPDELRTPGQYLDRSRFHAVQETEQLQEGFEAKPHVTYWTRIQTERYPDPEAAKKKYQGRYMLTPDNVVLLPKNTIIMHPLPRPEGANTEVSPELDLSEMQRYFAQMFNGLATRMALLEMALAKRN